MCYVFSMRTDTLKCPSELIVDQIKVTGIEMIISAKSEQLSAKPDQRISKRLEATKFGFDDTTVFLFMCLLALTII